MRLVAEFLVINSCKRMKKHKRCSQAPLHEARTDSQSSQKQKQPVTIRSPVDAAGVCRGHTRLCKRPVVSVVWIAQYT